VSGTRDHQQDSTETAPRRDVAAEVHPLLRARKSRADRSQDGAANAKSGKKPGLNKKAFLTVVVIGAVVCLLMGYWQLSRWNSAQGTYMNLGYSIEWPFFAIFLVFLYKRLSRLEEMRAEALRSGSTIHERYTASPESGRRADGVQTEIPESFLPQAARAGTGVEEPLDPTLSEYNSYLASLEGEPARSGHAHSTSAEGHSR